jgi:thioredoxin reductase (NADPH)
MKMTPNQQIQDCIVIGAGPGGLQGALHLARFNRKVLLFDRGGGRTRHAKHLVNYLGHRMISGSELIRTGIEQVKSFGVEVIRAEVDSVQQEKHFLVLTARHEYAARYIIGATGARENIPPIKNLGRFFAESIFTCVSCDGHLTTGKKLVILGNSAASIRLALGMKQMYTKDITLVMSTCAPPEGFAEILAEENIRFLCGQGAMMLGDEHLTGVQLTDSTIIEAEAVMLSLGARLNDSYLKDLGLDRNEADGKFLVNAHSESSLPGLYLTGALCQGHAQAIIAAGQGAAAAIDINRKLLAL